VLNFFGGLLLCDVALTNRHLIISSGVGTVFIWLSEIADLKWTPSKSLLHVLFSSREAMFELKFNQAKWKILAPELGQAFSFLIAS
jgi:hypothetical protein